MHQEFFGFSERRKRRLKSRKFQTSWRESRIAREKDEVKRVSSDDAIDASPGRTSTIAKFVQETEAFISNIKFGISAHQLVQAINDSMRDSQIPASGAVTRCQMLKKEGTAVVLFANHEIFMIFQNLRTAAHGRQLNVRLGTGASKNRRKLRFHPAELRYSILELGTKFSADSIFVPRYKVMPSEPYQVVINLDDKRNIDIDVEIDSRKVRLQCPMKEIRNFNLSCDASGCVVVNFRLVRPPRVFMEESALKVLDELFPWGSFDLGLVLRGMKSNELWELGVDLDGNKTTKWARSTDPTSDQIFSRCLTYRMALTANSTEQNTKIVSTFFDFGLLKKPVSYRELNGISPMKTMNPSWGKVFPCPIEDGLLEKDGTSFNFWGFISASGVPFATLYWIEVLVGACKLSLIDCTEEDTAGLAQSLLMPNCEWQFGEQVLRDVFYSSVQSKLWSVAELSTCILSAATRYSVETADVADDKALNEKEVLVRRVFITPLRICPQEPTLETSNRILRKWARFQDNFIRTTFVDEDFGKLFFGALSPIVVEKRLRPVLRDGFCVAGRKFVFLAHSNSQLREHGCWFFDEDTVNRYGEKPPLAEEIRQWVGDLSKITLVGKHAARLGQGFSATTQSITVDEKDILEIDDIERNGHCFSDGIGVISHRLANQVRESLGLFYIPSAYQVRFSGGKGIVTVAPQNGYSVPHLQSLKGIAVRPSMMKFNSSHRELEICTYSRVLPVYLNQQIIQVLGSRGVPDEAFLDLLDASLKRLDEAWSSNDAASILLRENVGERRSRRDTSQQPMSLMEHIFAMLECGIDVSTDNFLCGFVGSIRRRLLVDIQAKARILVPSGVCLIGVIDESGTLQPGQVFIQTDKLSNALLSQRQVLVFRNPSLHPGDVQLLTLVDVPALRHLVDVIVFPSTGSRPHANEMSGGDYDGDIYCAIPSSTLFPTIPFAPMDFTPAPGPATTKDVVSVEDIQDNFIHYMQNDNVGRIATAHRVVADLKGADCLECLELAKCHSTAVDFMKTGVPAIVPDFVGKLIDKYPDFMRFGRPEKNFYESSKVLGKIYRRAMHTPFGDGGMRLQVDCTLLVPGYELYLERASAILDEYNEALWRIMTQFEVVDELEAISGYVSKFVGKQGRGRDALHGNDEDTRRRLRQATASLRQHFQAIFWSELELVDTDPLHTADPLNTVHSLHTSGPLHTADPLHTTVSAGDPAPAVESCNRGPEIGTNNKFQSSHQEQPQQQEQLQPQPQQHADRCLTEEGAAAAVAAVASLTHTQSVVSDDGTIATALHSDHREGFERNGLGVECGARFELYALQQASAWYYATYTQEGETHPFVSFPWMSACDMLLAIKLMSAAIAPSDVTISSTA